MAELAAVQEGAVAREQLVEIGFSTSAIDRLVEAGHLHHQLPGVYSVGHRRLSWRGKHFAAVLWAGEDSAISHPSAAALWDLRLGASAKIHVTVRAGKRSTGWVRTHRVRRLDPADVAVLDGLRVTSLARTLLDIAETESARTLERAIEQAERMRLLDLKSIKATCERNHGRRGLKPLAAALTAFDPKAPETNQGLERDLLRLVRKYRLPEPQINVQVGPYVVDFLWEDHNLIVEADSYEFHRDRATFESDRKRDIQLRLAGYTVIRLTHRRLREEPAVVANELRALLSAS
jgi:very-short-patch-repair endonuclease